MSQSRQSLPPPPTPQAETRDALDDLQRAGAAVSSTPATAQRPHGVSLLFPSSVNRPATANATVNAQINTPSQATSEQSSSRKKKTPSSTSSTASTFAVNRNGCLNSFFFTQFRDNFIEVSAEFVADDNAFSTFKTRFVNQTNHRFRLKYQTAAVIEQQLDSQPRTRSEARALVESFDLAADRLQTSDFRRLSRLHLEDIFCLLPGDPMKMYISHEAAMNQSEWWGGVFTAAISRIHGSSETTMINGFDYYCFDVNVSHASLHSEMKAGLLTPEQVGTLFSRKNGFSVIIGGHDNLKLTVQWDQVIEYSTSLMFFGPPSTRTRLYSKHSNKSVILDWKQRKR
eukprot:scaffold21539_cov48-Cyclotella_meneghiniana.AAC.3